MKLARMYINWCRRNDLRCTPVAFEPRASDLFSRLVLDVQGPGAEYFLDCERGMHRLRRHNSASIHTRIDVIAQQSDGMGADVRDRSLLRGPFSLMAQMQSTLALPHTGQNLTFVGESRASLAGLVSDLHAAWSSLRIDSPQVVRSYGESGARVLDPRSNASASMRAVERGRLETFHNAFTKEASSAPN